MIKIYQKLFQDKLLNEEQYQFLNAIENRTIVSIYHDLRLMLYLGIMLFTSGLGYFVYQNMGEFLHFVAMVMLGVAILAGNYFIHKFSVPFSTEKSVVEHAYLDYILILTALLIIALFSYIQVYFDLVQILAHWSSFISAGVFLFFAYRHDNKALLAMGITALTAGIGLSISLIGLNEGAFLANVELYLSSISLGAVLFAAGQVSSLKNIKKHFKHIFQQIGLLLFYGGLMTARFSSDWGPLYGIILLVTAMIVSYHTWHKKELLLFLTSNIAGYIAFTIILFADMDLDGMLLFYYIPITLIAYPLVMTSKKDHFTHE